MRIGQPTPDFATVPNVTQHAIDAAVAQTKQLASQSSVRVTPTQAAQTVLNTSLPPSRAAAADAVSAFRNQPVVPVPDMWGGGFVSAAAARSSVQNYFFPPTLVSQVRATTPQAHAVAIAAAQAQAPM